jgi:hypothetical protein
MPQIIFLAEKNPEKNTEFFLDLLKPTLISRESEVAKKGAEALKQLI